MWWFGKWDSTKGAWDVDAKSTHKRRNRDEGIKAMKQGAMMMLAAAVVYAISFGITRVVEAPTEGIGQFFGILLMLVTFAALLVGAFHGIMFVMGIYYYIRYYKVRRPVERNRG